MKPNWYLTVLAAAVVGCDEFSNAPLQDLNISTGAEWRSEWLVLDSHTVVVNVTLPDSTAIVGVKASWESDTPEVLEVVEHSVSQDGSRNDSLVVQLSATLTAHTRGSATITVTVEWNGTAQARQVQRRIDVHQRWKSVSAGASHTCAIAWDDSAYCWGAGDSGAIGDGRPLSRTLPVPVVAFGDRTFTRVSAGDGNTCAIGTSGLIYCWGLGANGRLGNGDGTLRSQLIPTLVAGGRIWTGLSAGATTCGIATVFVAHCWGDGNQRQLGFQQLPDDTLDRCPPISSTAPLCSLTPRKVTSTDAYLMVDVGLTHTCALLQASPHRARCWGNSQDGALGGGPGVVTSVTPRDVVGGLTFSMIATGGEFTCGLREADSAAFCWGNNNHGQLGNGTMADTSLPVQVSRGLAFVTITAGRQFACGVTGTGVSYCWGQGFAGQLGNDSTVDKSTPSLVFGHLAFESLSAGDLHTCGVTRAGSLFCWGSNASGQLGTKPDLSDHRTPVRVSEPS